MAGLILDGVGKDFGALTAVEGAYFALRPGEIVALLGPSGCGKTTLLRLVAGFERPDRGTISHRGATLAGPGTFVAPEARGIGIVFQSHALWPHMTVGRNVAYPLELRRMAAEERSRRVEAALERVGLAGFAGRDPAELSGGQRQRVALARCLVMETPLVLLDEPLASLDPHLRDSMIEAFGELHAATGAAMLYVTHDQGEAMALAHRIAVMSQGRILQIAAPETLYREPATAFVARFVGSGTLLPARLLGREGDGRVRAEILGVAAALRAPEALPAGNALASLRPEGLAVAGGDEPAIPCRVRRLAHAGGHWRIEAAPDALPKARLRLHTAGAAGLEPGAAIRIAIRDGWAVPSDDATEKALSGAGDAA